MNVIKELREYFKEIMRISYTQALLGWAQETNLNG